MSSVVISGDTSGAITVAAPAIAGTYTQTLPMITGTLGTLNSGTAVASTSGTSIDFTSLPANIRRITVMLSGVSTNGTSNLQIQLGASGGVETSGYTGVMGFTDQTSPTYGSVNLTAGVLLSSLTAASYTFQGQVVFCNISGNTWSFSGNIATVGVIRVAMQGGFKTLANPLTTVRLTTVNGTDTFDAGSVNILYE